MYDPAASRIFLILGGIFTLVLGCLHALFPALVGYRRVFDAYPGADRELRPFRFGPLRYPMDVEKAYGVAWLMNFHVSLVLVTIGGLEIAWPGWLVREGRLLALWIAAWWGLRAVCQPILLGRRWYDWLVTAGFATLVVGHAWVGCPWR